MKNNIGMELRANGKINLYLDVISKESDGFHNIKSIMQSVSLCDRIIISAARSSKSDVSITCDIPYIPCDERNIAHKAVMKFLNRCAITAEVTLNLQKRIPVSGGMAGGSTDAAAVLSGINRLFGSPLPQSELYTLAAELGSDVPFCLMGKTALCEGRGEKMTPLESKAKALWLIVPSSESVSTPWAYGKLDAVFGDFSGRNNTQKYNALTAALACGDIHGIASNMYNIFEDVILKERPVARRAKELLLAGGALGAMMSGSGPTTFGLFENAETRTAAAQLLKSNGYYPKFAESMV